MSRIAQRNQPCELGRRPMAEAKCTAHLPNSGGVRCRGMAMRGSTVCRKHGGKAPQTLKAAARRLQRKLDEILDPDRVLEEIACVAFFDPGTVLDKDGNVLPFGQWPEESRRALAGWEVVKRNLVAGDGQLDTVLKTKLWDKGKALEMAAKIRQLYAEKVDATVKLEVQWQSSE